MTQPTASQGRPSLLVNVATRPSFSRLSPPSAATHKAPAGSGYNELIRPSARPLEDEYEARTCPPAKKATAPRKNPNQRPVPDGSAAIALTGSSCRRAVHGTCSTSSV